MAGSQWRQRVVTSVSDWPPGSAHFGTGGVGVGDHRHALSDPHVLDGGKQRLQIRVEVNPVGENHGGAVEAFNRLFRLLLGVWLGYVGVSSPFQAGEDTPNQPE